MTMILGPSYRDFIEGKQPLPVEEVNIEENKTAEDTAIPVVYGLRRVSAPIIWMGNSDYDGSLICVYALAEAPCYGIYRLFVDGSYVQTDLPLTIDGTAVDFGTETYVRYNGTGNAATIRTPLAGSRYDGIMELEYRSGIEDFFLNVESSTSSTYTHKILTNSIADPTRRPTYNRLSYLVCKFIWDGADSPYAGGIPRVTVDLFGKILQPHTDTTQWDWTISSSANVTAGASALTNWYYETNPVAHLKDYLTDVQYGAGMPFDSINQTSWESVYSTCNAISAYNLSNGKTYYGNKYTSNLFVNTENSVQQNIQSQLNVNNFLMPFSEGEFRLILETGGNPEVTFTENSIVDEIKFVYPDANSRYNAVYFSYPDAEDSWSTRRGRYPELDADVQTLITADDGNINTTTLSLPSVTHPYLAEQLARQLLEKSRNMIKVEFTIFKDAWKYQVGDLVQLTTNFPDLTNFEVRIVSYKLQNDDLIKVVAYSHTDENYIPFGDVPQSPFDYIKPLIPVKGGFIKPSRPTDPISVEPPTTGNPGDGDAGYPSEPDTQPVIPTQPGEDLPTTPGSPTYFYRSANILNFAQLETLGPDNEYLVGKLKYSPNPSYTYEVDQEWRGPNSIGQLRFMFDFEGANLIPYPRYEWKCALTHRNGKEETVGYVYEIAQTSAGKEIFGHALPFPSKWNRYHYYWDPENPTATFQYKNLLEPLEPPGELPIRLFNPPKLVSAPSITGKIEGTLVPDDPIIYSRSGVFQPLTFPVVNGPYRDTSYHSGNINYLELEPGGKVVPGNFFGSLSSSSFTIKIKFFTIAGLQPFVMGRYLGEKSIEFSNANLNIPYLSQSQQQHSVAAPGETPPF